MGLSPLFFIEQLQSAYCQALLQIFTQPLRTHTKLDPLMD